MHSRTKAFVEKMIADLTGFIKTLSVVTVSSYLSFLIQMTFVAFVNKNKFK